MAVSGTTVRRGVWAAIIGAAALLAPQLAQAIENPPATLDPSLRAGKRVYATTAVCADCHGWAGDGVGNPRAPHGANLRKTALTRDQVTEVVRCGRPGTAMPHHDRAAYTDDRCYGATAADLGDQVPPAGRPLSDKQITDVVNYLFAEVVGKGDPTAEECQRYFGPNAAVCRQYQPQN